MISEDTKLENKNIQNIQTTINQNPKDVPIQNNTALSIQNPPSIPPNNPPIVLIVNQNLGLPFDVESELNLFPKVFITKGLDFFRSYHCSEEKNRDYVVYGLLPDGDKKILFTSREHYKYCPFCDNCSIPLCCGCEYVCCNRIVFQMDYKRNGASFYTQGFNVQKGCYCCKCYYINDCCNCCNCCNCCCGNFNFQKKILFLRENIDPDNPDFDVGVKKGQTAYIHCCGDSITEYRSLEGLKSHSLRLRCCEAFTHNCKCICCLPCRCKDVEIDIEDQNGLKNGNIIVPNGCYSERKEIDSMCYSPNHYYEINFPPGITSGEKFHIITQAIHLDLQLGIL